MEGAWRAIRVYYLSSRYTGEQTTHYNNLACTQARIIDNDPTNVTRA